MQHLRQTEHDLLCSSFLQFLAGCSRFINFHCTAFIFVIFTSSCFSRCFDTVASFLKANVPTMSAISSVTCRKKLWSVYCQNDCSCVWWTTCYSRIANKDHLVLWEITVVVALSAKPSVACHSESVLFASVAEISNLTFLNQSIK